MSETVKGAARRDNLAGVAHLTARFGVERRFVQHHDGGFACGDGRYRSPFPVDGGNFRVIECKRVVAVKLGGAAGVCDAGFHLELAGGAGALPLLLHGRLEAGMVDHDAAFARNVRGEVHRKAEGVVELEDGLAVEHPVLAVQRALEHFHAVLERLGKALLLRLQHLRHALFRLGQLRIGLAHRAREVLDDAVEERLLLAELVAVADRAADDPAQHVAAALVAGNDPVHDQERAGADVIGDDLERVVREVLRPRLARRGADQVLEQVDVVVGMHALQARRRCAPAPCRCRPTAWAADAACRLRRG